MMGMIPKEKQQLGTAWILAICFAVIFMIATTIQDMNQSAKIKDLEHRIEILSLKLEQQRKEIER